MIKFAIHWILDWFKPTTMVETAAPVAKKKPAVKKATTRKPTAKKVVAKKATTVVKKAK
jgi:hypothetical protein